jgi:hypothetical protein
MVRRIIGFRLTIRRLEGKWKMGQNRPLRSAGNGTRIGGGGQIRHRGACSTDPIGLSRRALVPRRVFQRLLPERPTPERCVEAYYLQRTRFESIAERKLRWSQLTEDGNVEIRLSRQLSHARAIACRCRPGRGMTAGGSSGSDKHQMGSAA